MNVTLRREQQREWFRLKYATDSEFRQRKLAAERQRKRDHIDRGLCADCGQPRLSEWYCWDCLGRKQDSYLRGKARELGVDA